MGGDQRVEVDVGDAIGVRSQNGLCIGMTDRPAQPAASHRAPASFQKMDPPAVVHPPPRFGVAQVCGDRVIGFDEKPREDSWINGGFFVFHRQVVDVIDGDHVALECQPLRTLALSGQLTAFPHHGFWQCMDTSADVETLRALWSIGDPPWDRASPLSVEES